MNSNRKKQTIFLVGFLTFFFGFGAGAILNVFLGLIHDSLVLNFRSSLTYISAIFGDGIILPFVNMIVVSILFKYQSLIKILSVLFSFFLGFLITFYFHFVQASQNLVNWAMPKPWQWNFLGLFHALYMLTVSSLLSLFYIILILSLKQNRKPIKEAIVVTFGLILFFILLKLDYR